MTTKVTSSVLTNTAVSTGTYGGRANTTVITVDAQGRITYAANVASAGATGGGTDTVFYENSNTVTTSYTLTTGKNAMSTGPITINTGVAVTVPANGRWVVL